jgi:poly(3-hydroxyalkanoate) synthetase
MKCFAFVIVIFIGESFGQESLSALSLLTSQLDFFESMCINRSENSTVFAELKETLEECQDSLLNGTELELTFNALLHTDPKEFYQFYES